MFNILLQVFATGLLDVDFDVIELIFWNELLIVELGDLIFWVEKETFKVVPFFSV